MPAKMPQPLGGVFWLMKLATRYGLAPDPAKALQKPHDERLKPQSAPIASMIPPFHASRHRRPATSIDRAELPAPPPFRCGASSA